MSDGPDWIEPEPDTVENLRKQLIGAWRLINGMRARSGPRMSADTARVLRAELIFGPTTNVYEKIARSARALDDAIDQGRCPMVITADDGSIWLWNPDPRVWYDNTGIYNWHGEI